MNENIMSFEYACKVTYDSKKDEKKIGPKKWVKRAIKNKLFDNYDTGFTRVDGVRDLVANVDADTILLAFIDVMIKLYDAETKFGNIHNVNSASSTVHLINSNNGMEDLLEQLENGLELSKVEYIGKRKDFTNEEKYFKKSFDNILDAFVSANMSFNLLSCNTKLVSLDSQKASEKLQDYIINNYNVNKR